MFLVDRLIHPIQLRRTMTRRAANFVAMALLTGGLWAFLLVFPSSSQEPAAFDVKLLDAFVARNIGPANMGGRVTGLAIVEGNPAIQYVATASGGLWKTVDAGKSWTPLFDHQSTISIGDVAVARSNPDVVWVGTGESNARNSVTWGDGVYKSTDGGKTWRHMGLKETHHIGRIVIHPKNPDIVYVAALGHLWGPNKERGLYKTTDGGKTWQHAKYIDDKTGFIDVAMDPAAPDILYAAAYCVRRDGFSGGNPEVQLGPGAGLYKSDDAGRTWVKMTQGLPKGQYGRCGFDIYRKDTSIVYAVVQSDKTPVTVAGASASVNKKKYTTDKKGGKKKEAGEIQVDDGGIFRSEDKGQTWKQVNSLCPRPFYYGQIRIDPNDDKRIYVLGTAFHMSKDGGLTFNTGGAKGVHVDHHAMWINPRDSKHLVLGNDGGLYYSRNMTGSWEHIRRKAIGQFYAIGVDMRKPYRVYGGLQDNGSWGGPSATPSAEGITLGDWKKIGSGDGFYCLVDPTDPNIVYWESQYGIPRRLDVKTGKSKTIRPPGKKGEAAHRYNWSSPMLLSPHDPKTIFYGGNRLFRSDDRGDKWETLSPDLTRVGKDGASRTSGHTLTTIAESPLEAGLIYVGSDDGMVHVTKDGGKNWTNLSDKFPDVPPERWITRVECSQHAEGTAFVTLSRYRNDDRKPYVFKTTDHGASWQALTNNLPAEGSVHVIRESSRNKELLFVGTEYGVFTSLTGGRQWHRLRGGLPTNAIHDLVIHPRERDLVIATHGRSVYVVDIGPLEELTPKVLQSWAHLFDVRPALTFKVKPLEDEKQRLSYIAPNPTFGATIHYYLKTDAKEPVSASILDAEGRKIESLRGEGRAGLQRLVWNLRPNGEPDRLVAPGIYDVRLYANGQTLTKKLRVEAAE
jgi:photosystem II stability/assembly factor-like uncharacterized protein